MAVLSVKVHQDSVFLDLFLPIRSFITWSFQPWRILSYTSRTQTFLDTYLPIPIWTDTSWYQIYSSRFRTSRTRPFRRSCSWRASVSEQWRSIIISKEIPFFPTRHQRIATRRWNLTLQKIATHHVKFYHITGYSWNLKILQAHVNIIYRQALLSLFLVSHHQKSIILLLFKILNFKFMLFGIRKL